MIRWTVLLLGSLFTLLNSNGQDATNASDSSLKTEKFSSNESTLNKYSDGSRITISVLTLTPGNDLYSVFGHTAIRINDPVLGTDIVYNYGTFNFSDPNFLPKFIRGELDYFVSQETYQDFVYFYSSEERGLEEQILNLTAEQKINIQQYLFWNMEPENRFYRYNFLNNNCTTKIRDILNQFKTASTHTDSLKSKSNMTFRDGLHFYLDRANQHWIKLGIDIILGSSIDKKMTTYEAQFLPDFLEEGIDSTKSKGIKLVQIKEKILQRSINTQKGTLLTPFFIFGAILIIYILLLFSKNLTLKSSTTFLEVLVFIISGLIGCLLIFLWTYTLHEQSKYNYNVLWAFPTHLLIVFFYNKKNKITKAYWLLFTIILTATMIFWFAIPQQLNYSLIPLFILMIVAGIRNYQKQLS